MKVIEFNKKIKLMDKFSSEKVGDLITFYFYINEGKGKNGLVTGDITIDVDEKNHPIGIEVLMKKGLPKEKNIEMNKGEPVSVTLKEEIRDEYEWQIDNKNKILLAKASSAPDKFFQLSKRIVIGVKNNKIVLWQFKI